MFPTSYVLIIFSSSELRVHYLLRRIPACLNKELHLLERKILNVFKKHSADTGNCFIHGSFLLIRISHIWNKCLCQQMPLWCKIEERVTNIHHQKHVDITRQNNSDMFNCCFTSPLRILLYKGGDCCEGQQYLGLCLAPMAFEQGRSLMYVPQLLWVQVNVMIFCC